MNMKTKTLLISALASGMLVNSGYVIAQDDGEEDVSSVVEESWDIEEIVVTARFREETVQRIGASIEAKSGAELVKLNIASLDDLAKNLAGIANVTAGPGQDDLNVRGLANARGASVSQTSTSTLYSIYLDDAPIASVYNQPQLNYFDIGRVELLRGPQPTLYGEGSVGGTLRFFSKDPDLDGPRITGDAHARYETITDGAGAYRLENATSFVLIPGKLGIRATEFYQKDNGFIDTVFQDANGQPQIRENANAFDVAGGRIILLAKPTDDLEFRFSAYLSRSDIDESNNVIIGSDPDDLLQAGAIIPPSRTDDFEVFSARMTYDADPIEITSVTSYFERNIEVLNFSESDTANAAAALPSLAGTPVFTFGEAIEESLSQEFRFVSQFDGRLNFAAGFFYQDREFPSIGGGMIEGLETLSNPPSMFLNRSVLDEGSREFSGFIEATYEVTDRLRLIAGGRYVDERVTGTLVENTTAAGILSGMQFSPANPIQIIDTANLLTNAGFPRTVEFQLNEFLPRGAIEFEFNDDILFYANAAVGVRNGGINNPFAAFTAAEFTGLFQGFTFDTDPDAFAAAFFDSITYEDDGVLSIDGGVKSTWLDGDLKANVGVFWTEYEDTQLIAFVGGPLLINGPDQRILGMELETSYQSNEYISGYFNATLLDTEFQGNVDLITVPLDGNEAINSPTLSFSMGADFEYPVGLWGMNVIGGFSLQYIGERFSSNQNFDITRLNSITDLGLRIGVENERFRLTVFSTNTLNDIENVGLNATDIPPAFAQLVGLPTNVLPLEQIVNRPRTVGIDLTFKY